MRALDLRSEAMGNPRLGQTVRRFFGHAGRGEWDQAAALVSDPLDLLGAQVARADLAGNDDRSLSDTVTSLLELPPGIPFSLDEQGQLFGGALAESWRVCFVTLAMGKGQDPVSYGLAVDLKNPAQPLVARLFDPAPFKRFAAEVAEARRPDAP
ncbi:MAG: hypothetical protein ABIJ09_14900 [Pseudomonadota bacterium]